ncbi:hypothetical protein BH09PAT1_BH09PAT1_3100 [soil metagenome]
MEKKLEKGVRSPLFQHVYKVLGVLFIVVTYFVTVSPNSFIKFGYIGIVVFNILSSGLLILPVLLHKFNIVGVILASSLGNVVNTTVSYLLGASSTRLFSKNKLVGALKSLMKRYGLLAVFVIGVLPLPIDINGLLSGYLEISYKKYIVVNFLAKVTTFVLFALGILSLPFFFKH